MQISNLIFSKSYNLNKTSNNSENKRKNKNKNFAFGSQSALEIKAQLTQEELRIKNTQYAINSLTTYDREKYTQQINPFVKKILDDIPDDEFLSLCLQRKFGKKRNLNALEASTRDGAKYIVDRLNKEDLKKFLSGGLKNLYKISLDDTRSDAQIAVQKYADPRQDKMFGECWFPSEDNKITLWKNNALGLIFDKLGPNEIADFYSSPKIVKNGKRIVTYFDSLLANEPECALVVLNRLKKEQVDSFMKQSYRNIVQLNPELLCLIAKEHIDNEEDRFWLFSDGFVMNDTQSIKYALDFFSSENLEQLLDEAEDEKLVFRYIDYDAQAKDKKDKIMEALFKKLPPEKYPHIYSQTKKFPFGNAKYTILTSAVKAGIGEMVIDALPKDLIVKLLKKDEMIGKGTFISPIEVQQIARKIGKTEYNNTDFKQLADFDLLLEANFEEE